MQVIVGAAATAALLVAQRKLKCVSLTTALGQLATKLPCFAIMHSVLDSIHSLTAPIFWRSLNRGQPCSEQLSLTKSFEACTHQPHSISNGDTCVVAVTERFQSVLCGAPAEGARDFEGARTSANDGEARRRSRREVTAKSRRQEAGLTATATFTAHG